ncbi:flagellar hook-length control protein FliK [Paenarthrobacter sp. NPDC058040]|uniref:flagellar hook-length control protein FliK n=1 Tax=unclassified Paenarthrobacter TaxID=2634190 RepID=UPI0036DE3B40
MRVSLAAAPGVADVSGTGSFDAVLGGMLEPGSGVAASPADQFDGSLQGVPGARHDLQLGIEWEASVAEFVEPSAAGSPSLGHLDDSLRVRRLLPSNPQQGIETEGLSTGVPVPLAAGARDGVGLAGAVTGQFVGSLQGVPGARHDPQPGIEPEQRVAAAGESLAVGSPGTSSSRLDDSLPIRRFLPSNTQQAIQMGGRVALRPGIAGGDPVAGGGQDDAEATGAGSTSGTAGGGYVTGPDAGSVQLSSGQFVGSLPGVPGARHDLQQGTEQGQSVAGSGESLAVGSLGTASGRLDDSLPIRRFLPSNTQQGIESVGASSEVPLAAVTGAPAGPGSAEAVTGQFVGSLQGVPGARHDLQQGIESEQSVAGSGEFLAVGSLGTASDRLDDTLPIRRFLPSSTQQGIESVRSAPSNPAPGVPQPATPGADAAALPGAAVVPHAQLHVSAQAAPPPAAQPLPQPATPPQPLAHQLTQPLFALASAKPGEHVMTLRVSPEDLGPLTVRAHIDGSGVRIELFAAGDAGREAVRHVLPELRRGLEDSGASLSLSSQNSPQDARADTSPDNSPDPGRGQREPRQAEAQTLGPRKAVAGESPEVRETRPTTNRLDILV